MSKELVLSSLVATLALALAGSCTIGGSAQAKSEKYTKTEVQSPMKIVFVRTGGYPYGKWGCKIDTEKLPEPESRKLHALIEGSGILSVGKKTLIDSTPRNDYLYKLSITTGAGSHLLTIDEVNLPVCYGALIEYLETHSISLCK